jgi:hypothetical protein
MSAPAWHASDDDLIAFAHDPRALDHTTAASLETHLVACAQCRTVVAAATDTAVVTRSWDAHADVIDRPRRSLAERMLAVALPPHMARLLAATPVLQVAWFAAVTLVSAAAVAATRNLDSDGLFLLFAPLVPLGGVALAFAPAADPAGETALATPAHGAAVVVVRTLAVVATSVPILLVGSAFLPVLDVRAVAWLLPALALTAATMALSTWWVPQVAAASSAAAWVGVAYLAANANAGAIVRSGLFGPAAQLGFAALLVGALCVGALRRDHFTTLEAR